MAIVIFFSAHWVVAAFFQSFFHHRYASHRMFTMGPRTERTFHFLTYLVQGPSYLSPRAYAVLHREHHAYSDTEASRNFLPFDFLTLGELFQNNHHRAASRLNFAWRRFEFDPTYAVTRLLAWARVIRLRPGALAT